MGIEEKEEIFEWEGLNSTQINLEYAVTIATD